MSRYVPPHRAHPYGPIYTVKEPDPMPEMPLPNDEQMVNAMRRIHIEGYMGELKRAGGIFETPDASSQIFDFRSGVVERNVRIDDFSLSVWTGRYVRYFSQQTDDHHERAIRAVLRDLHNSDEARQKRGDTVPPTPSALVPPVTTDGMTFQEGD